MDKSQRILVVDDNPTNRRILVKSLGKMGYEMLEANDGFQAVDMATTHQPDLILLDIMMPERDGFEACSILKAQVATAATPIIFLTAKSESEDIERAFSLGGCDYITKPFRMSEIKARVSVHLQLQQAQNEVIERNRQLEEMSRVVAESNIELARQARIDPLTMLLNRRAWEESMTLEHDRFQRHGEVYAIVMIDVDHFKAFNDSHGHQAGDDCLRAVARCIQAASRTTDYVGRYGGEEFVVLAPETDAQAALTLAERIRKAIAELNIPHTSSLTADLVTVSLGVAVSEPGSWEDVLKRADGALYAAKKTGRNRTCAGGHTLSEQVNPSGARHGTSPSANASREATGDGASVLVVDDNPANRAVCRRCLERDGYEVREAPDGRAALAEVARELPHVILMDVMMPDMDGLACVRRLRSNSKARDIPIIMVSARTDAPDIRAALEAGADEYLTKPIRPAELALRVRSMMERRLDRRDLRWSYETHGEQTRLLGLMLDLCRTLGTIQDLDEALEETISAVAAATCCRRVSIIMPGSDHQTLRIAKSIGIAEEVVAADGTLIGESIARKVLETGRRIVVNSEHEAKPFHDAYESAYFASVPLVCTSLGVANHIVGALTLTDRVESRPFDPRDLECIDLLASIGGTAIHAILTRQTRDQARDAIMVAFAKLAEHRDTDTPRHVDSVTKHSLTLAGELRKVGKFCSQIDDVFMYDLERAGPLHDIGKVAIPDRILLNRGKLTAQEIAIMKTHAAIGADTIRIVRRRAPGLTMLQMAEEIASSHHEWYDGTGYPKGLRDDAIPLSARIVALADVYDTITAKRPDKDAVGHDEAVAIILKLSGTQFDPAIVGAFMRHESAFKATSEQFADSLGSEGDGSTPKPEPQTVEFVATEQRI